MSGIRRIVLFAVGNPLPMNRHSAGKYLLLQLAEKFGLDLSYSTARSQPYTVGEFENYTLVKSLVYMNESGKALKQYLSDERPSRDTTLVLLYDDFDINIGKVRISPLKSPESHNGLSSCQQVLNRTSHNLDPKSVFKFGVGIGPKPKNPDKAAMSNWVLSKFKLNEVKELDEKVLPISFDYLEYLSSNEEIESVTEQTARINKLFSRKIQRGEY